MVSYPGVHTAPGRGRSAVVTQGRPSVKPGVPDPYRSSSARVKVEASSSAQETTVRSPPRSSTARG